MRKHDTARLLVVITPRPWQHLPTTPPPQYAVAQNIGTGERRNTLWIVPGTIIQD